MMAAAETTVAVVAFWMVIKPIGPAMMVVAESIPAEMRV